MKKILVLNYEFPPLGGGASPISFEIAKRLSETGNFDIDVVTMGYKDLPKYEEVHKNFRIYRVRCLRSKKELCHPWEQATYLFFAWFKCQELLKNTKYDICHCHFIIPTGVLALKLKKRFDLPYIITSHGSDIPGYNTDRFQFLHKFTGSLLKKILNNAKGAYCGSQYLADLGNKINSNTKYKVIREGFDSSKFTPQSKKDIIFSSGRLLPRKGFQYLIKAVSDTDLGYEVHIAGDGPMMNELKELASKSKTKVVLHGWLDNRGEKYKNLLEQASIYVLASEKENASVSLLEAMSAGCAMITTNVSGCPETVEEAGLIVLPRDHVGIRESILQIMNNTDEWGNKARKRILENYTWENTIKNYIKIYE